jgi:hypothetical protein
MHAWGRVYRRRLGTLSVEDIDMESGKDRAEANTEYQVKTPT